MFFILCIALSIFSIQYAADNILPNTTASIGFTFEDNKTGYYQIKELHWSETLQSMLNDANISLNAQDKPSHLEITQDCFDCLHTLISSYQKPAKNRLNKNKIELGDEAFRKHLRNMLNTNQLCTKINKVDLLKAADYLSVDTGIQFELAALCTDDLKNEPLLVSDYKTNKNNSTYTAKIARKIPIELQRAIMQWLFRDLIADQKIQGEMIKIPANFVTTAPAFTKHGIGFIENDFEYGEARFFYYDFLEKGLPKEIVKIPNGMVAHIATDGDNIFCICTRQSGIYMCEMIPLNNVQNKKVFTVSPASNTTLIDIVYDQKNNTFVVIFEDRPNKKIYLYPVSDTQKEPIEIQSNIDLNPYAKLTRLWRSVDRFFIRYDRDSTQSWFMYDTVARSIALDIFSYNFYPQTFDIIEFLNLIDKRAKDIVPLNQNIPNYNTLMSERAISDTTKNTLRGYNHTFDPSAFCYLALQPTIISKSILTIYSLLPYTLKHAMHYILDSNSQIQNRLLTAWYLYHAALKTEQWKVVTPEIANDIDSYVKKLYPLPPLLQPKLNLKNQIIGTMKRNLGALLASMQYTQYTYGTGIKNILSSKPFAFGLGLTLVAASIMFAGRNKTLQGMLSLRNYPITIHNNTDRSIYIDDINKAIRDGTVTRHPFKTSIQ